MQLPKYQFKIKIFRKWIRIECVERESSVELSVTDSGNGIPLETREKLMQPFFTTKVIGKGTGLGLSISKGIVESHEGSLRVDAESPHTRFVVTIPKKHAKNLTLAA
ncbi:MAG: hypothetical protein H7318_04685 [Oligoflexus sp.]|nr:hypothetical protein [Oligoflexus sp.]